MEMGGLRKRPNEFPCKPSFLQGPQGKVRRDSVQVPLLVKGMSDHSAGVVGQIHTPIYICAHISNIAKSQPLFLDAQGTCRSYWCPGMDRGLLSLQGCAKDPGQGAGRGAGISMCVDWPLEGDGEPRAWNVGLHRDPSKASDPCGSLQFTEWSCHRWGAGCDADGAVGWGKDKSSWSDVRGRLKGTFLGSFHGHPVSCSSLPSQCAHNTSLLPQPSLLSCHWGRDTPDRAFC